MASTKGDTDSPSNEIYSMFIFSNRLNIMIETINQQSNNLWYLCNKDTFPTISNVSFPLKVPEKNMHV